VASRRSPAIGFGSPDVCVKPGAGYCSALFATMAILKADANGLPILPPSTATDTTITVPANTRVTGVNNGFYAGRVYAPSATLFGHHNLMVFFAGYHTPKPKNRLGDYRTIGRVGLHTDRFIVDAARTLAKAARRELERQAMVEAERRKSSSASFFCSVYRNRRDRPVTGRSGWRNFCGEPAERRTASAAR
jgi:hypothetical protein